MDGNGILRVIHCIIDHCFSSFTTLVSLNVDHINNMTPVCFNRALGLLLEVYD